MSRPAEAVVAQLRRRRQTLALAESVTGGLIASLITAVPGASKVLMEGRVVYTEAAKRRLGVSSALLRKHGPVSEPVTRALAEAVRKTARATYGLAVTGMAGPSGREVGTVFVALVGPGGTSARRLALAPPRIRIQRRAARAALDLLRRACGG